MAEKVCQDCGSAYLARSNNAKRCPDCRERPCEQCGMRFEVEPHKQRFCSHACRAAQKADDNNARFWEHCIERDGCWEWTGVRMPTGYGLVSVYNRQILAHRRAFVLANGRELKAGEFVCHHCDNPPCINPAHLFAGTPADNMTDMVSKGRQRNWSKLTENQVREIRADCELGEKYERLASRYGVSYSNIYHVATCRTWKHVT